MGKITLNLSEQAESVLRGKNRRKGDMSRYIEKLLLDAEEANKL